MYNRSGDRTEHRTGDIGDRDAGLFEWEVADDMLRADGVVAKLFGFSVFEAEKGLPVLAYIDRIHPQDRKRVARAIHESLLTFADFREAYSIQRADGSLVDVAVSGRCFRNRAGDPAHFSGVIYPARPKPKHNMIRRCLTNACTPAKPFGPVAANNA